MADNDTQPQMPTPDPALKRLEPLVGTWSMEGHLVDSKRTTSRARAPSGGCPAASSSRTAQGWTLQVWRSMPLELIGYDPETNTFPSTVFSGFSPTPLPYKWDVSDDTLTMSVSYGPLDTTFKGTFSEDGESFGGGWRPNPGADESVNVPYDIAGSRLSKRAVPRNGGRTES
jgi:hypothetical protein